MKIQEEKTNAVRLLSSKKINFTTHTYQTEPVLSGAEIAKILGENPDKVFKTLVTVGKSNANYVFVVPVEKELDLKAAAAVVGEKSISMIKSKELLPLTGYIHGGCSPIGMKKFFPTVIDESAKNQETILFSGGRIGLQVETSTDELAKVIKFRFAPISKDEGLGHPNSFLTHFLERNRTQQCGRKGTAYSTRRG